MRGKLVYSSYPVLIEFRSSLVANSKNREVFASFKAYLLAFEKDAAVPTGDLGSAPPSANIHF